MKIYTNFNDLTDKQLQNKERAVSRRFVLTLKTKKQIDDFNDLIEIEREFMNRERR